MSTTTRQGKPGSVQEAGLAWSAEGFPLRCLRLTQHPITGSVNTTWWLKPVEKLWGYVERSWGVARSLHHGELNSIRHTPWSRKPNRAVTDMKRRWVYPNASSVSSGDGSGSACSLVCEDAPFPAVTSVEIATTVGSMRITQYPASAQVPSPGTA